MIILFLFILFNENVFAITENKHCFKKFTLAFYSFGFFYSTETKTGIDKDVAIEMMKRSKCSIEMFEMPRIRIWKSIENGSLDFATSGLETIERDKFAYFALYNQFKNVVIFRKDANVSSWNSFFSNKLLKLGVIRGYKHGEPDRMIDVLKEQNRVIDYAEQVTLYDELNKNSVQAILGSIVTYKYYIKRAKGLSQKIKIEDWTPQQNTVKTGIVLSKKVFSKVEADYWKSIINGMNHDGTMMKIFRKYFSEKDAKEISLNVIVLT